MKLNIRRRVMLLATSAVILTVLALLLLSVLGMSALRGVMEDWQLEVRNFAVENLEQIAQEESQKRLANIARVKAYTIDLTLQYYSADVERLAYKMTNIMTHSEKYLPRDLLNPSFDGEIPVSTPYVFYNPKIAMTPEIETEYRLASNIAEDLISEARLNEGMQGSFCIGSKNGYIICLDIYSGDEEYVNFTEEFMADYDPRERPWYKQAKAENKFLFTDLYFDMQGYMVIDGAMPYYDSNGFAGAVSVGCNIDSFQKLIEENALGGTNFNVLLDGNGKVLFLSGQDKKTAAATFEYKNLHESEETTITEAVRRMMAGENGVMPVMVNGKEYYLAFAPVPTTGWSFGTLIAAEEVNAPFVSMRQVLWWQMQDFSRRLEPFFTRMQNNSYPILAVLVVFMLALSLWMSRKFSKPITELTDGVKDIAQGNLDRKLNIKTSDEIEHLATCFNAMTDELKNQMDNLAAVTAEKERIETELNVATGIQAGMLPKKFPAEVSGGRFELDAVTYPARYVGGDFYDFYLLDDNHLAVTVADVSGKGIPASLFMVISKTVLKNFAMFAAEPNNYAKVMSRTNNQLCEGNDEMMFVTVFFGVLEISTGRFVFVNGGHNPPVLYRRAENRCEFLDVKKNFVLGGMEDVPFKQQEITLERGDLFFAYSDGVNEAMNVEHEEYTSERLLSFMNGTDCTAPLGDLLAALRADVAEHVGEAEQSDDITMLALRLTAKK